MAEPLPAPGGEALAAWEVAADEVIGAYGGNAWAAVVALLIMNDGLWSLRRKGSRCSRDP